MVGDHLRYCSANNDNVYKKKKFNRFHINGFEQRLHVKGQVYFFVFKGEKFSRYRNSMPILAICRMIFRYTYNRP